MMTNVEKVKHEKNVGTTSKFTATFSPANRIHIDIMKSFKQ